ncbi:MAG: TAXI family TRAP transporter solute-binding subunit [Syntrophobacteraceae bacterium]
MNSIIFFLFVTFAVPSHCLGEAKQMFRIGTGGLLGAYYPIGKLIAQGLTMPSTSAEGPDSHTSGLPGFIGVAQSSGGSVANVHALAAGEIEAGLVQADVAAWALEGSGLFAGNERVGIVRAVASLYSEKLQIVTRRDAHIGSIPDLKGKRISIDELGSGTLAVMRAVLEAHGTSEKEMLPIYLKPEFTYDKMRNGELDGFAIMAGAPIEAVTRISDIGLNLLPILPEIASLINEKFPYLVPGVLPADVYPGVAMTPTLQVHALLVVSTALPENVIYQLTAALWSERTVSFLRNGHPMGKLVDLKTALEGISIPLHPGAERFYREQGMLPGRPTMP